ncbi:V-type ATP synthase subunit E [Thermococcus sp.]|uniref:V-type ATP synthase subunit E n=1 Tax=Thermococcus sp. TaxID=35749 RepID=UPI00261D3DE6|nr:V-type ATP synthase subunit E [Thermococcus sp.]
MEGAERIIQEINREAEQKIQYLLSEAQEEANKILEEAKKRAEVRAEWILRKAQTGAEIEKQRIIAGAKLEVRKRRLALQEELIQKVITALHDRLSQLPDEEYFPMLVDLTSEAVNELGMPKARILSNERTLKLLKARRDEFESAVADKVGRNVKMDIGEPISTIGGVLVESEDRSVRVDNTFEARMERFESDLRARIAKALFG